MARCCDPPVDSPTLGHGGMYHLNSPTWTPPPPKPLPDPLPHCPSKDPPTPRGPLANGQWGG